MECPVSLWRWAASVAAGNIAAVGTGYIAKRLVNGRHPTTTRTIELIVGASAFWLVGGLTWVALNKPIKSLPPVAGARRLN